MHKEQEPFILIVDDNPRNLQVLGNILREKRYKTAIAKSGLHALKLIDKKMPDLILLDIMMPEMDGFEVCRRLKRSDITKDIPIIFISALTEPAEKLRGFKLGGVDYITKPFHQEEVFARVDVHLKLKQSREELRAANAIKDKLFSIIAHDLKSPIATLSNALEMMVRRPNLFDEKRRLAFMSELMKSTKGAYDLLENLLYWARNQRGEIDYQPEILNLSPLIDANIRLLSGIATDKSIWLHSEIEESVTVYADQDMLTTLIRNLISNALKFTGESGEVSVSAVSGEDFVEISVSDNGVGIHAENMEKLFRPDEHFTTYGTRNEKGSGLGLMLCREFAEKNGGKIWAESEEGRGSTFKITLPAHG
jgi:signal transduction histidine kinase